MNKTLLLLLAFLNLSAFGQNLTFEPAKHINGIVDQEFSIFDINIKTEGPEAITYHWETLSNSFDSMWDFSLCDHGHCYIGIPELGKMWPITAKQAEDGAYGFFKITVVSAGLNNSGKVEFYVYDSSDYNRGDTVSFSLLKPGVQVNNISNTHLGVYPNPCNDIVQIIGLDLNSDVRILDLQGKEVVRKRMDPSDELDVSKLSSGFYRILIQSEGIRKSINISVQH